MSPQVFSAAWFDWHQDRLLWLANHRSRSVQRMFRGALRIRPCDVGYDRPIVQLLPHAYLAFDGWRGEQPQLIGDFRTHDKYAKRLYYAFHPLWRGMHEWDRWVANRLAPELNLGFDTLEVYPNADADASPTTTDGWAARHAVDETWATIIAGVGTTANDDAATVLAMLISATATANQFAQLRRFVALFNTAALGDSDTVTAAVLSIVGLAKEDTAGWAPTVDVYISAPASNTAVAAGDYNAASWGSTSQTGAAIAYASLSTSGYQDFTLNTFGAISLTSVTKLGLRSANYDVAATLPAHAGAGNFEWQVRTADTTGTTTDPKLVVTYTPASPGTVRGLSRRGLMGVGR